VTQILSAFIITVGVLAYALYRYVTNTDEHELPKFFGAAFGAAVSSAVAILLFFLTRHRDRQRSNAELFKLEKAMWLDAWTTLPGVYNEYLFWEAFLKRGSKPIGESDRLKTYNIIVEHLRSAFFEANLGSLPRVAASAQTHLLLFHDNLRIAREELVQISEFVSKLDIERSRQVLGRVPTIRMTDLEQDLAEAANDLLIVLKNALAHGWLGQEALDIEGLWRGEFAHTREHKLWHDSKWILGVNKIVDEFRSDASIAGATDFP
jgi:hypothetical protein